MAEKIWPNKEKPPVKTEGLSHYGLVTNRLQEVLNHSHSIIYNNNKPLILLIDMIELKSLYRL